MSAYASASLDNVHLHDQLDELYQEHCMDAAELDACKVKYPDTFYTNNFAIRTGLFILTTVITLFSFALITFLGPFEHLITSEVVALVFGLIAYGTLEFIVHTRKHFRSGVDDALIWITFFLLISISLPYLSTWQFSNLQTALWVCCVSAFLAWRFLHPPMSAIACIAFFCLLFFAYNSRGALEKATAPFVILITSTIGYIFLLRKENAWLHYRHCINLMKISTLLVLYASCNYFVVREMSKYLLHLNLPEGQALPLGWIFWLLSAVIPIIYIYAGIVRRDLLILRTGFLLFIALIFTIRYYHHLLPLETALITGGLIMIGGAYFLIKYLERPRRSFTSAAKSGNTETILQLESLLIAQAFSHAQPVGGNQTTFGGGSGGGGGAGSDY